MIAEADVEAAAHQEEDVEHHEEDEEAAQRVAQRLLLYVILSWSNLPVLGLTYLRSPTVTLVFLSPVERKTCW